MRLLELNRGLWRVRRLSIAVAGITNRLYGWRESRYAVLSAAVLLLTSVLASAQTMDPCASGKQRALVLGGGGVKGAFEAGAIYHLVVLRRCDFNEFSGVSVGALNATFLAQAAPATDPSESYSNLAEQTEALVSLWQSLKSQHDIARGRFLATLRFGIFGLDSMVDFTPLHQLEDRNISLDKLYHGRPVRVGFVSFHDGEYREVLAKSLPIGSPAANFMEYLHASSTPPVLGKLPQIPVDRATSESQQFADGSLRHITPIAGYFAACPPASAAQNGDATSEQSTGYCSATGRESIPPHLSIQQLFVIVTSPYSRDSEARPILDPKCCRRGTRQMTDGRKILGRTLALLDDEVYRQDLDFLLSANAALAWRWQTYRQMIAGAPPDLVAQTKERFRATRAFAFESYNSNSNDPDAPSQPYEVGLIVPEKEYADLKSLVAVSPASVQEQLYCGCVAADQMMQKSFGMPSLAGKCAERFTPFPRHEPESLANDAKFEPIACQPERTPELQRTSLARTRAAEGIRP